MASKQTPTPGKGPAGPPYPQPPPKVPKWLVAATAAEVLLVGSAVIASLS